MEDIIKDLYAKYILLLDKHNEICRKLDNRILDLKNKIRWHKKRADSLRNRKFSSGVKEPGTQIEAGIQSSLYKISEYTDKISILAAKRRSTKYPYWTDQLLPEVISRLVAATSEIDWELREHYNVMGLRAASSVWGKTREGYTVGVTFTYSAGKLYFDTGKVTNQFARNTLGEINGMNNVSEELKELNQFLELIARQIHDATEHYKRLKDKNAHQ